MGDRGRLLVGIVLKKLYHQSARHTAEKRSVAREVPLPDGGDSIWQLSLHDLRSPTAEQAVAMAELVESLMADSDSLARQVLEMRLSDYRITEIASAVQRNERTVRRILDELKTRLARLLQTSGDPLPFAAQPFPHGHGSMVDRRSEDRDASDIFESEDESADGPQPEIAANDGPSRS